MADFEKSIIRDEALEKVSGGAGLRKSPDFLYRAEVTQRTEFFPMVPNLKENPWAIEILIPGEEVRVMSEEIHTDYLGREYLYVGKKIDVITMGYVLADALQRVG